MFKSFALAVRSVKYNYKRYLCFFVMLFVIQTLFSAVLVLYANNNSNQVEYLENNYDYHLKLQNLNDVQFSYIADQHNKQPEEEEFFSIVKITRSEIAGIGRNRYEISIHFDGKPTSCYKVFSAKFYGSLEDEGEFDEFITPLLKYELDYAKNTAICALTCIFVFICGCVIIYLLDSIMVNHYKFLYGVYMTFGANFKKLFVSAFFEMLFISLAVFVPSQLITNVVCFVMLKSNGLSFRVSILSLLLSLIMCILVAGVPVFINIKSVSRKTPLSLIGAIDNSNHITSPQSSADFIAAEFPKTTELLSMKRFRKYLIKLVLATVSFASVFVCCAYLGNAYSRSLEINKPQFSAIFGGYYISANGGDDGKKEESEGDNGSVSENDEPLLPDIEEESEKGSWYYQFSYDSEMKEYLYSFEGVEMIFKNCFTNAYDIGSHVKLPKKNAGFTGGADDSQGDRCYLNAEYTVLDPEVAEIIKYKGYEVEGSLSNVINKNNYIAITDGYNNSRKFKLSVGDKIYIATSSKLIKKAPQIMSSDYDQLMTLELINYKFEYKEYTVGAIIKNSPVGKCFPVYMNEEEYVKLTGNQVIFDKIDIMVSDSISDEQLQKLDLSLKHAADYYSNMMLTNNDSKVLAQIEQNKKYESVFTFIAIMLLIVTPIIFMFSQILFYLKRRPEFDLYFALGAPFEKIKKLFLTDAIVTAVLSLVVYSLLSWLMTYGLSFYINSSLYEASSYIRYAYKLPILPFVIGGVMSLLSALSSALLPCYSYLGSAHPIYTGRKSDSKEEIISEGESGI